MSDIKKMPGGMEDELARRMSSLGGVPEYVENSDEVGGDSSGELVDLGLIRTREVPIGTLFSGWIGSCRESCGFKSLTPHGFRKRITSSHGQHRLSKYRQ